MTDTSNTTHPSDVAVTKRWRVETQATVTRIYFVDAANEKAAEAASCEAAVDYEEDETEETMSITEMPEAAAQKG